jgi:exopolysaccharide biosynthesis WecB/TagA/CpsF family protein
MIDHGKRNLLGILIDAVDYTAAVEKIIAAAHNRRSFTATALAVHGVMTGVQEPEQGHRLNHLDLVVPDGQPVRWAMNLLHNVGLRDRVYGPTLTLKVCESAAQEQLPIFLYGSQTAVLVKLAANLQAKFPNLQIAGMLPSRFRTVSADEQMEIVEQICRSGAALVLVGLGCPRQEVWVYEHRQYLPMPALAVGAAFDFHAGTLSQAPKGLQDFGLEWLFRLAHEPRRLWKRYVLLNPQYVALVTMQLLRLRSFPILLSRSSIADIRYG